MWSIKLHMLVKGFRFICWAFATKSYTQCNLCLWDIYMGCNRRERSHVCFPIVWHSSCRKRLLPGFFCLGIAHILCRVLSLGRSFIKAIATTLATTYMKNVTPNVISHAHVSQSLCSRTRHFFLCAGSKCAPTTKTYPALFGMLPFPCLAFALSISAR